MSKADDDDTTPRRGKTPEGASRLPPPIVPLSGRARVERPSLDYTAAASLQAVDPHPTIPPEWLQLADAPYWIDRVHGVRGAIKQELFHAVRSKLQIQHRIWCEWRYRNLSIILPDGLVYGSSHGIRCIHVSDWEATGADWTNGTVGGWKQDDGTCERLPIEVLWEAVDRFTRYRLQQWKRDAARAAAQNDEPQDGCLYLDGAVLRIMERLGETERVAAKRLLDALGAAAVWAWIRTPDSRNKVAAAGWKNNGDIDLDHFRDRDGGGVRLNGGGYIHLYRFLVPEDILDHWLDTLTKAAPFPAKLDKPSEATLNKWMAEYTSDKLAKRDDALKVCRAENRCTYRQALAAWKALPATAKREPRQTDRAMSGHSARTTK